MDRDEALKKSDQALHELADALKNGKSEALIKYLDMVSRFHQYSFGNCMLIAMQMPTASQVAGFHCWKQLGRWVKKGGTGIMILAPMVGRRGNTEDNVVSQDDSEGKPTRKVFGFRAAYVFDVSQTEGAELPEFAALAGDPGEMISALESLIRSKGIEFEFVEDLGGANGVSKGRSISVVATLDPAQKFSTMVHELAHELLHRGDRREQLTKTIRETEAEAVAYIVCRSAGIECSTRASDYIQLYSGDDQVLSQSLELIRDVAVQIITELDADRDPRDQLLEEVAHVG